MRHAEERENEHCDGESSDRQNSSVYMLEHDVFLLCVLIDCLNSYSRLPITRKSDLKWLMQPQTFRLKKMEATLEGICVAAEKASPQRLKPHCNLDLYGTTEVVP